MTEKQGLHDKYIITKTDGSPVDPGAQYFVLRIDTDRCARFALNMYAKTVKWENQQLADDIRQLLDEVPMRREEPS